MRRFAAGRADNVLATGGALDVAARRGLGLAAAIERRLTAVRPAPLLAVLVALQLGEAAWFAFRTPHNGWIWYSGGDSTSYWSEQWALGHLQIPQAVVGYALPVFYAWVPLVKGPTLVQGAPVIALLQLVVLVPLALVLFWATADRLFGRVYAWAAAALWVAGPLLLLHGFVPGYHWVFDQLFLAPHWFGMTNMADMPSLVAVLACAWITLRGVDTASATDMALGGLLAGLAIGIKPSNGFLLPPMAVLVLGIRRPRHAAVWAAGLVPALITLALWKYRGLGYLPLTSTSYARLHVAAGAAGTPLAFAGSKYLPANGWHHLGEELANLREVFWSLRFLEFLAVAGAFGAVRKAPLKGSFVVVWFASYCLLKTSSPRSDFPSATYFRLGEPGLPAYILLTAAVAFCLPRLGRRVPLPAPAGRRGDDMRLDRRVVVPAATVLALVPLLLVAVARQPKTMNLARDGNVVQEAPLGTSMHLTARRNADGTVTVSWRPPPNLGSFTPSYTLYLSTTGDDNGCTVPQRGALECSLDTMTRLATTQATTFVDRPQDLDQARWYRVALTASFQRTNANGDLMLVSGPVLAPPPTAS